MTNLGSLQLDQQFGPVTLKALFGPAVLTGFEGQQTIGVATVNQALCLLHTGHMPPEGLLEKTRSVLAAACNARKLSSKRNLLPHTKPKEADHGATVHRP